MTDAPRSLGRDIRGVVAVWAFAAVVGIVVGVAAPPQWRGEWIAVGLAGCVLLAFVVQLAGGTSHGFIRRVALSVVGALAVLALITAGFAIAAFGALATA